MPAEFQNRFRLGCEVLEGRALPAAGVGAPSAGLATTGHVAADTVGAPAGTTTTTTTTFSSVVTLKNATSNPITYSITWATKPVWVTLPAGATRLYITPQPNQIAHIVYDDSTAAGFQGQAYNLVAQNHPSIGTPKIVPADGMQYQFDPFGMTGVQLHVVIPAG